MLRLLSVSLLLFLAACNGGEDFSDAELGGQVLQPSPEGNSLNPGSTVTEVVFAVGGQEGSGDGVTGVVNNLGYSCGEVSAYIPGPDDNNADPSPVENYSVARCPKDAKYVDFFIGQATNGGPDTRVELGRVWIPATTNQGFYQVTPADLIESPSRVPESINEVDFMTTFLQSLDKDNDPDGLTPQVIEIPSFAHEMVLNAADPAIPDPPSALFSQANYGDFYNDWKNWMTYLDSKTGETYSLPLSDSDGSGSPDSRLKASLDRIRAGTYSAQALSLTAFGLVLDQLNKTQNIGFQISAQVYPDGVARAVGLAVENDSNPQSSVVALKGAASMSRNQELQDWTFDEVPNETPVDSLELFGRVLGNIAYYDAEGDRVNSDYDVDYPDSDYDPLSTDQARFTASAYGKSVDRDSGLYWLTRTGQVAVNWMDQDVLDALATEESNRFYDIQFFRACTDYNDEFNDPACRDIDANTNANEIGPGLNYPEVIDSDGAAGTGDDGYTVVKERPKVDATGGNDDTIRVHILDNGNIITDQDKDCSAVTGDPVNGYTDGGSTSNSEYRVGFVSRTNRDSDGNPESFNIVMLMTDDVSNPDMYTEIPQFSTQVAGRVDVQDVGGSGAPMYRLSDTNFDAGVRAFWTDLYTPREKSDELSDPSSFPARHLIAAFSAGAAQGSKTDLNDCSP